MPFKVIKIKQFLIHTFWEDSTKTFYFEVKKYQDLSDPAGKEVWNSSHKTAYKLFAFIARHYPSFIDHHLV